MTMRIRTIAIGLQKGGVGKTTTTLNLGVHLAEQGARVLLIDLDPQANLTTGLGVDASDFRYSIYDVLLNARKGIAHAIMETHGVSLIPSVLDLAGAEVELSGTIGRDHLLASALAPAAGAFDYVLIDTPPSLGVFTANALGAADAVLVPMQCHPYSFRALAQFIKTVELVRERVNARLSVAGIVCTLADYRTSLSRVVEEKVRRTYGDLVFETVIPDNTTLAESSEMGRPAHVYAPRSAGALAYRKLAAEFSKRLNERG